MLAESGCLAPGDIVFGAEPADRDRVNWPWQIDAPQQFVAVSIRQADVRNEKSF